MDNSRSNPVRLDDHSEPQRIWFAQAFSGLSTETHRNGGCFSGSSRFSDTTLLNRPGRKLQLRRAGVPEVWIVNLADLTVEVYRDRISRLGSKTILRAGVKRVHGFPDVAVDVAELRAGNVKPIIVNLFVAR